MDAPTPAEPRAPSPARMSKTPSWIMLGFVLGALSVWVWRNQEKPAPPPPPVERPAPRPVVRTTPLLTKIEAVFAQWGRYAVWANDTTEVALWQEETGAFSDCYEVLRVGETLYFRSITRLTRPVIKRGVESQSPLQFTGIGDATGR
ncbi:MAG: hypothetical protein HZA31_11835 [Opitutae bacterium]|nr:hypothetical protein [Opitutae bacterium]